MTLRARKAQMRQPIRLERITAVVHMLSLIHILPDGWIVVTAGNPPEYNRTAHDFDIATWDRLKRIDVEPDFAAWRDFAVETGVHPAVLTYLDIERDHFYRVETTVDGKSFVTARGWDDLSAMMKLYEEQDVYKRQASTPRAAPSCPRPSRP